MKRILYFSMFLIVVSCNSRETQKQEIPNDSLINVVIHRLIEIDSIQGRSGIAISEQFCPYIQDYSLDKNRDPAIPPPNSNSSIINPITPNVLLTLFKSKIASSVSIKDTSFFLLQIENSKNRFLDLSLFKEFKMTKVNYLTRKDYFRQDSILVLYLPIFTPDKRTVYVNYHFRGNGKGTILKLENNDWKIINEFDTWNTD